MALAGYVVTLLGPQALWNHKVWWQSIAVWFLAAIIAHDLILFPLYALADRSFTAALAAVRGRWARPSPQVSPLNYLRVPTLAAGLSLLLFFPGIIQQGQFSYIAATGQNQQPFFGRWLLLVAALYGSARWPTPAGSLSPAPRDHRHPHRYRRRNTSTQPQ